MTFKLLTWAALAALFNALAPPLAFATEDIAADPVGGPFTFSFSGPTPAQVAPRTATTRKTNMHNEFRAALRPSPGQPAATDTLTPVWRLLASLRQRFLMENLNEATAPS